MNNEPTPIGYDYVERPPCRSGYKYSVITTTGETILLVCPKHLADKPLHGLVVGQAWYKFARHVGEEVSGAMGGTKVIRVIGIAP